ncbi:MAG: hypothetical protein KAS93_06630 [Gammaproteobacteria bacterium]|nr:hypothetical protein [Gammaproteobacteria bacterium]
MVDLTIPVLGATELAPQKHPFPEIIEPMDSAWWLKPKEKSVCDLFLGECLMDQPAAFAKIYKPKTPSSKATGTTRFFKRARVRRYLYFRTRKIEEKIELTQEEILRDLMLVRDMALGRVDQKIVVGQDKGMVVTHVGKNTDLKAANQALTQLGKFHELGMWIEKKETEVQVVNFNFNMGDSNNKNEKVINNPKELDHD